MAYGKVKVNGQDMEFKASAATPVIYHRVFKQDLLKTFQDAGKKADDDVSNIEIITQLGFIMAMQAEKKKITDLSKLNDEMFLEWLDRFNGTEDIPFEDIMNIYNNNNIAEVDEKKDAAE